jgi:hypothetical protein
VARPNTAKRVTAELAAERNRFVAAISDEVLIPFAAPGSRTEALALNLLAVAAVSDRRTAIGDRRYNGHGIDLQVGSKTVYTFSDRPGPLLDAGARLIPPDFFSATPAAPK